MFYIKSMHNTPMYSDVNIGGYKFLDLHLLGPVIAYGEEGEAGQVLTAQGGNVPPKWEDPSGGGGSLPTLGTAGQMLQVNAGATALEYFTPSFFTLPSFTSGSVIFSNGTTLAQDNSNFYYDDLNDRLGLGTTSPVAKLSVRRDNIGVTQDNSYGIILNNTTAASSGNQQMSPGIVWRGQGWKSNVPTASQTVDFRVDVLPIQGTGSASGNWQISASINGGAYLNKFYLSTGTDFFIGQTGSGAIQNTSGTVRVDRGPFEVVRDGVNPNVSISHSQTTATSGTVNIVSSPYNVAPISGTLVVNGYNINPTINQTGGANGITRGLYIAPTLTAAADWRAIETTSGSFKMADTYLAGSGSLAGSLIDLTQTWNTTGTPTAFKMNVTDTASNSASLLMDLQVGGSSKFQFTKTGVIKNAIFYSTTGGTNGGLFLNSGSSTISSSANGAITLYDNTGTSFNLLQFGGTTSSFPALKRNAAALNVKLADDSAYATLVANNLVAIGDVNAGATRVIYWSARSQMYSPFNGIIQLTDNTGIDFNRLQFGGTTSSFPAIKRNSNEIQARLADDSDYSFIEDKYRRSGTGTPEGAVSAPVGAVYHRKDGGAGTSFYVKESGTGNTGWVAK